MSQNDSEETKQHIFMFLMLILYVIIFYIFLHDAKRTRPLDVVQRTERIPDRPLQIKVSNTSRKNRIFNFVEDYNLWTMVRIRFFLGRSIHIQNGMRALYSLYEYIYNFRPHSRQFLKHWFHSSYVYVYCNQNIDVNLKIEIG